MSSARRFAPRACRPRGAGSDRRFDNAMAESVFATLKTELIYRRSWPTRHELEMEMEVYSIHLTLTKVSA
jgi:hypothetical protein